MAFPLNDSVRCLGRTAPNNAMKNEHNRMIVAEKRMSPGSKIIINGYVKEVPIMLRTGRQSTRFDYLIETNYVEPVDEEFDELIITADEELKIKKIAKDEKVIEKLVSSIAPAIYDHEKFKEALLMQLLGGVRRD